MNARDGITPQLKIEDDCWWISYDGGLSWGNLGEVAPQLVRDIREDDKVISTICNLTFYL